MDKTAELRHLEKAESDIAEAHDRIAKQRALVATMRADGHDTQIAEQLLETMLHSARAMEEHRIVILELLGLYNLRESSAAPENLSSHEAPSVSPDSKSTEK
jgi:hypothetical protein